MASAGNFGDSSYASILLLKEERTALMQKAVLVVVAAPYRTGTGRAAVMVARYLSWPPPREAIKLCVLIKMYSRH